MLKMIVLIQRKEGLTHEQFERHWLDIHGPMAREMPELRRYTQSRILGEPGRPDLVALIEDGVVDGIAELWFDDQAALARYRASPDAKRWAADSALFIGRVKTFVVDEDKVIP